MMTRTKIIQGILRHDNFVYKNKDNWQRTEESKDFIYGTAHHMIYDTLQDRSKSEMTNKKHNGRCGCKQMPDVFF